MVVPRAAMPSRKRPTPAPSSETEGAAWVESDVPWRARWAGLPAYEGTTDSAGRPHGRGRLRLDEDGAWYEGRFSRGVRQGRGTLHFPVDVDGDSDADSDADPDASDPRFPSGGDRVTGTFADDTVEGWATYHCADGSSREGIWRDGELSGLVRERDPTGRVVFEGRYVAGARDGDGWIQHPDGGVLRRARSKTVTSSPVAPCTPTRTRTASRRAAPSARRVFKPQRRHARPSTPWANPEPSSKSSTPPPAKSPTQSASRFGEAPLTSARTRKNTNRHETTRAFRRPTRWSSGCAAARRRRRRRRRVGRTLTRLSFGRGAGMLRTSRVGDVGVDSRRVRGRGRDRGGSRARRRHHSRGGSSRSSTGRDARWRRGLPLRRRLWDGARPTDGGVRARVRARVRRRRWAVGVPTVNARFIFARTTTIPRMNTTTRTVANRRSAGGAGGIFLFDADPSSEASHRRTAGSAGIRARCDARDPPTCRREKFRHPLLGETWALVAERRLGGGEAVAQPPDYEGGWRVCPVSEAGYYRHCRAHAPRRDSRTVGRRGRRRRARDGTRTVAGRVVG